MASPRRPASFYRHRSTVDARLEAWKQGVLDFLEPKVPVQDRHESTKQLRAYHAWLKCGA